MRLKKVTLHNFRCFGELEVDLHPRLTVFVGENGVGKTAVLDGIARGLSPVLTYLSSANQRLSGKGILDTDIRLVPVPQGSDSVRWRKADYASIHMETVDGLAWDISKSSGTKKPVKLISQVALKRYLQTISESYGTAQPQLTPVIAYYGARRGDITLPERLLSVRDNYSHPASALIGALDSMSDFREMLAWFDQEEASELRENKGAIAEEFVESQSLTAVRAAIEDLLGGLYTNPHFNKEHKFVVVRKQDGAHLQVNQLSQGYQSMLALAMDYARRLAIGNPNMTYQEGSDSYRIQQFHAELQSLEAVAPGFLADRTQPSLDVCRPALALSAPGIVLIDEIDLHLHPTWQQRVLNDLMRAFPLTQFIVTTHSPQVLTTVARENIRVLHQNEDGEMKALLPEFSPLAHESGDALAKIMGTHREPELALQDDIRRYELLVRNGAEAHVDAQQLRQTLEQAGYQFHESDLATWRFLAARKAKGQGEND